MSKTSGYCSYVSIPIRLSLENRHLPVLYLYHILQPRCRSEAIQPHTNTMAPFSTAFKIRPLYLAWSCCWHKQRINSKKEALIVGVWRTPSRVRAVLRYRLGWFICKNLTYILLPVYSTLGMSQLSSFGDHSARASIFMYSIAGMN